MNRKYTREEFLEKVGLIRRYFSFAGITTDIIAGFPTETDQDFADTLSLIEKVKFSDIHPFAFSPRKGTAAFRMSGVSDGVKKERLQKLLEVKRNLKAAFAAEMRGKTLCFLPEEFKDGYTEGYSENYLRLYLKGDFTGREIIKVKVEDAFKDGAKCEISDK